MLSPEQFGVIASQHSDEDQISSHLGRARNTLQGTPLALARPVSLPPQYPHPMIDLGCIAGLHAHDRELRAYCCRCDRWRVLDLGLMVGQGKGSVRLPLIVRCRDCGEVGQLQVRPPMPAWSNSNGWIGPS